ncbi:class I SAM-dependent methyltransferase [Xanthobacteraceae bacterium A53D]
MRPMTLSTENGSRLTRLNAGLGLERVARAFLGRVVRCIEEGQLTVVLPSGTRIEHEGARPGPHGMLQLHNWRAVRRLLTGGHVAFAEGYMEQDWSSPDLARLIEVMARNVLHVEHAISGLLPVRLLNKLRHGLRLNSKGGSRRNISFHYDLGNDFYAAWLDPSMTYSSALYPAPDSTLEAAQEAKLARIVELLELEAGSTVLEIGCGWGALAARMAERGAQVTGLTLSREQLAFANAMLAERGLDAQIDLRLRDYRDETGTYDRIVSIEMIEAVGEAYWPTYFAALRSRLKPGGHAVIQAITIGEAHFAGYRDNPDFIQRYIFPGGMLPTQEIIARQTAQAGLTLGTVQRFGLSYAHTLADWRERFLAAWPRLQQQGFDARFRRMWDYYLAYCEAGFRAGTLDVGLYVLKG